jgi:hypothetical protein
MLFLRCTMLRPCSRHTLRLWCAFAMFLAFPGLTFSQLTFKTLTENAIADRLRQYGGSDAEREARLKHMFAESGCPTEKLTEQVVSSKYPPNVICVFPGQTDDVILVGAHFDHVKEGDGVVDNWSGASLLPSFMVTLKTEPRHHTFVLVSFTGEEAGLVGSEFYAKHLSAEERSHIKAMINLDTLGLGPTEVWATHSDPMLSGSLNGVAHAMKVPLTAMNVDNVGSTDSESFAPYKIPHMTVHSVTPKTWSILHSRQDQFSAIHLDDYYSTYRLLSAYLVNLDRYLAQAPANPAPSTQSTK